MNNPVSAVLTFLTWIRRRPDIRICGDHEPTGRRVTNSSLSSQKYQATFKSFH